MDYFVSTEFSLVDCCIASLMEVVTLWYQIPKEAPAIQVIANVFSRETPLTSLQIKNALSEDFDETD